MKLNLKDYFPENQHNGLGWPHVQLMVSEKHKVLYCPIAKNACSSLKRLMVAIANIEHGQLMIDGDIHTSIDEYRTGAKLGDLDIQHARRIIASKEYFKFAVIREPFARLVSAYLEKFVINRNDPGNQYITGPVIAAVQGTATPDFERGISFADFIYFITAQDPEQLDAHWTPQVLYLRDVDYDRIYRMDQISVLQRDLERRIGYAVTIPHKNRSRLVRQRYVAGSEYRLAGEMTAPERINKKSFMNSEIMFHILNYFSEDYRLYYSNARNLAAKIASNPAGYGGKPKTAGYSFLLARLRRLLIVAGCAISVHDFEPEQEEQRSPRSFKQNFAEFYRA